jgi:hypothetical protein
MTFAAVPFVFSPNTLIQSAQVNADFASVVASGNNIDASQITTGVLPVANGGTGASTPGAAATAIGALPLTGGTLTGPLTVPSISLGGIPVTNTAGNFAVGATITSPFAIAVSGNISSTSGTISAPQVIVANIRDTSNAMAIQTNDGSNNITYYGNNHTFNNKTSSTQYVIFNDSGSFNLNGVWSIISDPELKEDVQPYQRGLDAITRLNPVTYRYRVGTLFALHEPSAPLVGLMADAVMPHVPEIVGETSVMVDGHERSVATLTPGTLVFALINAVKELSARVAQLEAARGSS